MSNLPRMAGGCYRPGMTTLRRHSGERPAADAGDPVYRLNVMTQDDVPGVSRVERRCFANPWPASAYRRELQSPEQNYYVVLRETRLGSLVPDPDPDPLQPVRAENGRANGRSVPRRSLLPIGRNRTQDSNSVEHGAIVGFAGMWLAFDEAHVTTIGIDPRHRGRGLGELLLLCMFDEAMTRGANWLTLEVRISNAAAQALYRKYGFTTHGTRKRYYSDNNEDALIMWSPALSEPEFRATLQSRRDSLVRRLAGRVEPNSFSPIADPLSQRGLS